MNICWSTFVLACDFYFLEDASNMDKKMSWLNTLDGLAEKRLEIGKIMAQTVNTLNFIF